MTKKNWLLTAMLFLSLLPALIAQAQSVVITGTVTSTEGGTPLVGVTVSIKNTTTSAITDADGRFSITAAKGQTLQFSYVGFSPREVLIGNETTIAVTMQQNQETLSDVVVVGYGQQRRGNLTGAVTTVNVDQTLTNRPIADVGRGLQGAAAGLSVTIPSGEVGSDPIIRIRGQLASFQGSAAPLILLDNVEIPSIQVVNPNDIATITVLKDAASASIYGAKAAFGVVLITTKKGSNTPKPQVSYSNNFSFQNVWKDLQMGDVNALKYTVDAAERVGVTTPVGAFYYVDRASYLKAVEWKQKYGSSIGPNDPTVFGRDWYVQGPNNQKMGVRTYDPYEYMVKEWAPTQQHNLSVGLTSGKTSYNIGLGLLDQSGMMKPAKDDRFTRYNAMIKVSSEVSKHLTVRASGLYSRRNKEYAYATNSTTADPWLYIYRWSSLYPLGRDQNGDMIRSPESEVAAANTANILSNYLNFSGGGTITIMNNWKVDIDYTYTNEEEIWRRPGTRFTARNSWVAPVARNDAGGNPVYVDGEGNVVSSTTPGAIRAFDLSLDAYTAAGSNPDHIAMTTTSTPMTTLNAFTTYNLKLKQDHDFKAILGVNRVTRRSESLFAQRTNLSDIINPQFSFATGTQTNSGSNSWESQLGYFGRINYAFRNKYLLEGNLRYDGSSKFPEVLWWRWYPSVSAGWVVSEENFLQAVKPVLSFLKFRASWGSIGDQSVGNNLYVPVMGSSQSTWIIGGNRPILVGTPNVIDANIQWQDIESKNVGVDMGFWNGKMNLSFDLFERNTKNMLVGLEGIPLTLGAGAPIGNYGSLSTKGWELTIDFNHRFSNGLGINFRGNVADARTRLTAVGSGLQVTGNYNGKDVGEIWGYRTERLYQYDDFELGSNGRPIEITLTAAESALYAGRKAYRLKTVDGKKPVYQVFLQNSANFLFGPGDVKFVDLNGDGELNNGSNSLTDHGDLTVIGNSTPRYEYGFRLGADYKGFDFSAFFQGVGSRQIWGAGFLAIPGFNSADGAMPEAIAGNYWTPETPNAFYPAAYNNAGSNTANNMQVQDRYLLNMAYLRLKNLTVGYTLPENIVRKAWIKSLRVYVALENMFTWDHLGDLPIDPESISGYSMWNTSNYNSGRTATGIPAFKSTSFGLQVNF